MTDTLKGKVAVVTGAGRGIGRGIALLMAEEGAQVVVNDIGGGVDGAGSDQTPAGQVVQEIISRGGAAVASYDSVATMDGGERIIQKAIDTYGQLDIVVTVAGILRDRMVFNMAEEEWDSVIQTHLKGTFAVVKPACVLFRQQRSGRIITFSSTSGLWGNPGQVNYGAAKAGIAGFTRVVARDMGRYGVTANSIAPRALTRMTDSIPEATIGRRSQQGGRTDFPDPNDIAPMVCFLASDMASGVNGQIFHVYSGSIELLNQPRPIRTIFQPRGNWTLDELDVLVPETITKDLPNPAPSQARRD